MDEILEPESRQSPNVLGVFRRTPQRSEFFFIITILRGRFKGQDPGSKWSNYRPMRRAGILYVEVAGVTHVSDGHVFDNASLMTVYSSEALTM